LGGGGYSFDLQCISDVICWSSVTNVIVLVVDYLTYTIHVRYQCIVWRLTC